MSSWSNFRLVRPGSGLTPVWPVLSRATVTTVRSCIYYIGLRHWPHNCLDHQKSPKILPSKFWRDLQLRDGEHDMQNITQTNPFWQRSSPITRKKSKPSQEARSAQNEAATNRSRHAICFYVCTSKLFPPMLEGREQSGKTCNILGAHHVTTPWFGTCKDTSDHFPRPPTRSVLPRVGSCGLKVITVREARGISLGFSGDKIPFPAGCLIRLKASQVELVMPGTCSTTLGLNAVISKLRAASLAMFELIWECVVNWPNNLRAPTLSPRMCKSEFLSCRRDFQCLKATKPPDDFMHTLCLRGKLTWRQFRSVRWCPTLFLVASSSCESELLTCESNWSCVVCLVRWAPHKTEGFKTWRTLAILTHVPRNDLLLVAIKLPAGTSPQFLLSTNMNLYALGSYGRAYPLDEARGFCTLCEMQRRNLKAPIPQVSRLSNYSALST